MNMVEKVARALAPVAWDAPENGDTLSSKNRRTASLRHARAAIEAMREPTLEMRDAGVVGGINGWDDTMLEQYSRDLSKNVVPDIWQAMISEALK